MAIGLSHFPLGVMLSQSITARNDDAPAAIQLAIANVVGMMVFLESEDSSRPLPVDASSVLRGSFGGGAYGWLNQSITAQAELHSSSWVGTKGRRR